MPRTISLDKVIECAVNLHDGQIHALAPGVTVRLTGSRMTIFEDGVPVFWFTTMRVEERGLVRYLYLDRCETQELQRRRGWGKLGLLIALRYGLAHGASETGTGTEVELTSAALAFWGGIRKDGHTNVQAEIVRIMKSIPMDIQPDPEGRSVYQVTDRVGGGKPVKTRARASSLTKM